MSTRKFTAIALGLFLLSGCQQTGTTSNQSTSPAQSPVERGKYLVLVGGCNDCHTPKKMGPNGPEADMTRELSGNPSTEKLAAVPDGLLVPGKWLTITNDHIGAWAGPGGVRLHRNTAD